MLSRIAGAILGVLLPIVATPLVVAQAAGASPPLQWTTCAPVAGEPDEQCATLRVPLDYRRPEGRQIEIGVSRIATAKPGLRRGVLLLNPGGPGGSGIDLPRAFSVLLPQAVRDRYDLIGFDPRFVNTSTPITCGLPLQDQQDLLPWPLPGGVDANAQVARDIANRCAARAGDFLPFATTANTARDMDQIRQALGEPKISYLGYSYGTELGAVYSSLFPSRTDRVVLDSNVDPAWVWRTQFRSWGLSNEIRFPDFASFAAARDATYHLGATPAQVRQLYFDLGARLDAHPVDAGGFLVTGNVFREATRGALYSDGNFPSLAQLWQALDQAAPAEALAPLRELEATGAVSLAPASDNSAALLLGIVCDEASWPRSVERYERDVALDSRLFPLVGPMAANIFPCAFWHIPPSRPVQVGGDGPTNILLVQNQRDPATPLLGALGMRDALGRRARMVTVDQGGHGVYLVTPNVCANDAVTAFLAAGSLADRSCGAQSSPATATPDVAAEKWATNELLKQMRGAA